MHGLMAQMLKANLFNRNLTVQSTSEESAAASEDSIADIPESELSGSGIPNIPLVPELPVEPQPSGIEQSAGQPLPASSGTVDETMKDEPAVSVADSASIDPVDDPFSEMD